MHHSRVSGLKPAILPLILATALAACGGGSKEAAGPPPDRRLDVAARSGALALADDQPAEAARQYRSGLARAQEMDDIEAIGDLGFNLAVVELRQGNAREALRVARLTREEIERRKKTPFAALLLVEGMALYRSGDRAGAAAMASRVAARTYEPAAASRARYLQGLIAADSGDAAGVRAAAAGIGPSKVPDIEGDRQELLAREAMLLANYAAARSAAEQSADLRRTALDYRGMADALGLAGEAAEREQRSELAADYFLRAGRSALMRNDTRVADRWLQRARVNAQRAGAADIRAQIDALMREAASRRVSGA